MQSQPMQAADPDFAARVAASFARQGAMQLIGARLQSVEAGRVVIGLAHRSELAQQHGFVHAGILATALDSACGYAASSLMPADAGALTIEFKVNLLAPAKGPRFRLEGQVVKPGRTITVVEGRALQVDPTGAERLVATMTTTVMTVTGRDGIQH